MATVSSTLFSKSSQTWAGVIYDLGEESSFPEQCCSISWARRRELRVPISLPRLPPGPLESYRCSSRVCLSWSNSVLQQKANLSFSCSLNFTSPTPSACSCFSPSHSKYKNIRLELSLTLKPTP